jgi:pimeloyl-ACP methyl ester carboxylesterase
MRTLDRSVVDPAAITPAIRDAAFALALQPAVRRAFAGVYAGAIADFADIDEVHRRLGGWTGPTLLIWGRHDRFIPMRALDATRGVYPRADAVVAANSGHLPMVEEAPIVASAITRFLAA